MARLDAMMLMLTLAACGSVQTQQPVDTFSVSGAVQQAAVGSVMVNDTRTTVTFVPLTRTSRVDGLRSEFVYLGLLGSDPPGRNTIRVRYAEHRIADGVESDPPEYRAEVTLDLGQKRVIEFRGWRIQVIDATDANVRYEVIGSPAPR